MAKPLSLHHNGKMMKIRFIRFFPLFIFFSLFSFPLFAEDISPPIRNMMKQIEQAIDQGNIAILQSMISPNARSGLADEIAQVMAARSMDYQMDTTGVKDLGRGDVKVTNRFRAKGVGWEMNGASNYFVLQPNPESPYGYSIIDTDFQKKVGTEYVLKFVGKVFAIVFPLLFLFMVFWVWMLIDLIKRPLPNKTLWIVLMVVLGILGAVIYFFGPRRAARSPSPRPSGPRPSPSGGEGGGSGTPVVHG